MLNGSKTDFSILGKMAGTFFLPLKTLNGGKMDFSALGKMTSIFYPTPSQKVARFDTKFCIRALGCIHTCDFLHYCVNLTFRLSKWVTLYYMGAFTPAIWSTIAWTEKFKNGLCTHFLRLHGLKSSHNSPCLKNLHRCIFYTFLHYQLPSLAQASHLFGLFPKTTTIPGSREPYVDTINKKNFLQIRT